MARHRYFVIYSRITSKDKRYVTIFRVRTAKQRDSMMEKIRILGQRSGLDWLSAWTKTMKDAKAFCADLFTDGNNPEPDIR